MSKLLHLWQALLDKNMVRLQNESISLEGVQKIVFDDEAFLLGLACAELAENLRLVAKSVSRITKKCNDLNLQRFESLFDEFANWGHDPHGWVLSLKEMEARMKKMDRYITVMATLYREMDELSVMESRLSKSLKCKEKESTICDLQQNIFWQRQEAKLKRSENARATLTQSEKARESSIAVRATKQNAGASGGGGGEAGRGGALRGEEDKEGGHSKRHQSHRRSLALGLRGRSSGQDRNFSPPQGQEPLAPARFPSLPFLPIRSAVNDTDEWPSKYSKFFIELDDGLELSFTDKRRFAKVRLLKDPAAAPPISELGPDALLEPMTIDEFIESLSKKKVAIKALLLDQSYIAGIGNWIADEVLYQARIHPLQVAASLSKENCRGLHKCIKEVIEKAIEVGADSSQFPKNWIFHSREKKSKAFVDGKKIDFINAGGRTTAYVPELQKLSGNQAAKAVGEPKRRTSKKKSGGNDDSDEPANKEEEIIESDELKKGPKPRGRIQKKKMEKATAKAEKASKRKVQTSQNSKKAKKKAK
ncbi:hypothetical protein FH972_001944 [Carpinus fangiana]|uniref:Formamidopyrimidine-DNA glycosylase H2TH DNA-binding domain-containing protein n=1 Tax=Carpinus fangiana TaxID=176857 RepID=A0A5N6QDC2_9ROSI|nr:hypothetical protein FH972_001944 [Carpinus fangiana]